MSSGPAVLQVLLSIVILVPLLGAQQDWYVDVEAPGCETGTGTQLDPFCDVQDAVDAASDGDTIHIAPGTYFETVYLDKNLELVGTAGHALTILSARFMGSTVRVVDASVTLRGLTLTQGTGTPYLAEGTFHGGGLFLYSRQRFHRYPALPRPRFSRPRVELVDCLVTQNSATHGGGIANGHRLGDFAVRGMGGDLTLTNTTVTENSAEAFLYDLYFIYGYGGGISSHGKLTLVDSTVSGNDAVATYGRSFGGGIWSGYSGKAYLTDSIVSDNYAVSGGGLVAFDMTVEGSSVCNNQAVTGGGGIICADAEVNDTLIDGNAVTGTVSTPDGGGVLVFGDAVLTNSTISRNSTTGSGGGLFMRIGSLTMTNTAIVGNAADRGAGIGLAGYQGPTNRPGTLTLTNSTVTGNAAVDFGGALNVYAFGPASYVTATVENSILWDNSPDEITLAGPFASATVDYSDVEGGWPGTGNLDADPLFVDAPNDDLRLSPGSPCIDAADNVAVPIGILVDLLGFPRFVDDPATVDTGNGTPPIVDMGAIEFQ